MCPQPTDNFRIPVCPLQHCRTEHNHAKPMFEPSSAMTSIADDGEFRFARFYIVCEAVLLGTLGNPLIVCGLSDTFRGLSKRGRNTESDAKIRQEEMHTFFQRMFHLHFHQKSKSMIFCHIPYRIKKGQSASSDCPSFSFIGSIMFIPSLMRAWNLRSQ